MPTLPNQRRRLPADVYRDLRAAAPNDLEDVARAYAGGGEALESDNLPRALELLWWAKDTAPRSAAIREALGIALYRSGDLSAAQRELLTYRRLSGRQDQNHLLADCARAAGKLERAEEYVREMEAAKVSRDRWMEGVLVLAGARADRDDLEGALAILEQAGLQPTRVEPYHTRAWYLAGDLSERLGRHEDARGYFAAIVAVDPDMLDAAERLAALEQIA